MFKKPEREFKSLDEFKLMMMLAGRVFSKESRAKKAYLDYLNWYRNELAAYRQKMQLVKTALSKLTLDEQDALRLYWKT